MSSRLGNYAGSSPRLEAITWGAEDLSACIGGNNRTVDGAYDGPYLLARSLCSCSPPPAAGVAALDTIHVHRFPRSPRAGSRRNARRGARRSGFTGKMAIHPAQLAAINETFSTSAAERDWAERVIAAFAANPDAGTLALDGKVMIDQAASGAGAAAVGRTGDGRDPYRPQRRQQVPRLQLLSKPVNVDIVARWRSR